jgi:hypothetical protein
MEFKNTYLRKEIIATVVFLILLCSFALSPIVVFLVGDRHHKSNAEEFVVYPYITNGFFSVGSNEVQHAIDKDSYVKGANDALDGIMLLDLEQRLQGTNRTWGTMAEVVCERLSVERSK